MELQHLLELLDRFSGLLPRQMHTPHEQMSFDIRSVLLEDHPKGLHGLVVLLLRERDLGEAAPGRQILRGLFGNRPQHLLRFLRLPHKEVKIGEPESLG